MDDNKIAVAFCNWNTANRLIEQDKNVHNALCITRYLNDGEVIVVEKDEFLNWLRGEKE